MTEERRIDPELQPKLCCQTCGEKYGDGVVRPFGYIKKGVCSVCGRVKACHSAVYFGYLSTDWVREFPNNNRIGGGYFYAL